MRWYWWVLIILMLVGWGLRVWWVLNGSISFHYDMSRDAFIAAQIWQQHHLKIIGPPTSTPGLFHGVGYYYLIAPIYGLWRGDPTGVALFLAALNISTIIPIFLVSREIFKSVGWGIVSAILFTFAFEAVQYGPWISNPNPAVWSVAWFFYSLYQLQGGRKWSLVGAAMMAALSMHFQFFLAYLFLVLMIYCWWFKIKLRRFEIIGSIIGVGVILSTFAISTIKFNSYHAALLGLVDVSVTYRGDIWHTAVYRGSKYLMAMVELYTDNFWPTNQLIGGLIWVLAIVFNRRQSFVMFGLFSSLPIFLVGGHSNVYVNIGMMLPAMVAVTGVVRAIYRRWQWLAIVVVGLIMVVNWQMIQQISPGGQQILVIPKAMVLNHELRLIDQTYQIANGRPFSINTLTLPLWTNTTWAYLYQWYGQKKYGYLPSYYGAGQENQLGEMVFKHQDQPEAIAFFIKEPLNGIPQIMVNREQQKEDEKTRLIKQYDFDTLLLEYRQPLN